MLIISVLTYAQTQESAVSAKVNDLKGISEHVYGEYAHILQYTVDSVLFHARIDTLKCVVFDNVTIKADGTTEHSVEVKSASDKINRTLVRNLKKIKLPAVSMHDNVADMDVPVEVTASFEIPCNVSREWMEFRMSMKNGERTWEEGIDEDMLRKLKKFARIAFYGGDQGKFKIRVPKFLVNSELKAYGVTEVYGIDRKGNESLMIKYAGSFVMGQDPYGERDMKKHSSSTFPEGAVKPSFNGEGANSFSKWVNKKLVYPKDAMRSHMQGVIDVSFTVNMEGVLENIFVMDYAHPLLDREAYRVVNSSPQWTPGSIHGKTVNINYHFPVIFLLR